jgi:hypothetical protein
MSSAGFRPIEKVVGGLTRLGTESVDNLISSLFSSESHRRFTPSDSITEDAAVGNSIVLGPGNHTGLKLSASHTNVSGDAGCRITRVGQLENNCFISGVHFQQLNDPSNEDYLVRVTSGRVMFRGCVFERKHDAPHEEDPGAIPLSKKAFVLIDVGAKAIFEGCIFRSELESGVMDGAGTVVQNLNLAAGDVFVASSVNFTTHVHGPTVTTTGPTI